MLKILRITLIMVASFAATAGPAKADVIITSAPNLGQTIFSVKAEGGMVWLETAASDLGPATSQALPSLFFENTIAALYRYTFNSLAGRGTFELDLNSDGNFETSELLSEVLYTSTIGQNTRYVTASVALRDGAVATMQGVRVNGQAFSIGAINENPSEDGSKTFYDSSVTVMTFTGEIALLSGLEGVGMSFGQGGSTFTVAEVPEPSSLALAGIALAGLGISFRRRQPA